MIDCDAREFETIPIPTAQELGPRFILDFSGLPPRSWVYVSRDNGGILAMADSRFALEMKVVKRGLTGGSIMSVWAWTRSIL